MNHMDVCRRNWGRFQLKLAANKDHEFNNIFTNYRLKIARELYSHVRQSSLVANGCFKLKESCFEKPIPQKMLTVLASFTQTSLSLKFINERLPRHRRWIFVITSALYRVPYRFVLFALFLYTLEQYSDCKSTPFINNHCHLLLFLSAFFSRCWNHIKFRKRD